MIPYGRQEIVEEDIEAVVEVLRSDWLTQGPKVPEFEHAVAKNSAAEHAVAVNSGTSALHIACLALGAGPGDVVWTTPITFVASANCALYCGADIDFIDIDPKTYNMSVTALQQKLEGAAVEGRLPKIVISVHLCGQSCEMEKIRELADQYKFAVIEDACHALGGKYKKHPIGNCRYSDITVFSFHPVKIITTAEGGMALTNQQALADKMKLYRSHGITRDSTLMTQCSDGPWYYQQIDLGFNYRMSDLQAALGISQLKRLNQYVTRRHVLAEQYNQLLADLPCTIPYQHPESYSGYHLYVIRLHSTNDAVSHKQVFESMREQGIGVNLHYIPVHTQPYYQTMGFKRGDFPHAESYYNETISLPLYPKMTEKQQMMVVGALEKALTA